MTGINRSLPGTDAARHGTGDADLTIMLAAHDAIRRDLTSLGRVARLADSADPAWQRSVGAGWQTLKRQLHAHHAGEDALVWPTLRQRLGHSEGALSAIGEMEAEHALVDPLLAQVDAAFGVPGADGASLADAVDALADAVTGHLTHEERDVLPLIGVALSAREWHAVGLRIARMNGLSTASEMFAWMLDGASLDKSRAVLSVLPPPARLLCRRLWQPRYQRTSRW